MILENIVFLQSDDAIEAMDILENQGQESLLEYLKQWHFHGEHETRNVESIHNLKGTSDRYIESNNYFLTWNTRLGYCGLYFKLN